MPCHAFPVFVDDMPRFSMSSKTVAITEICDDPVVWEVKIPKNIHVDVLPNEIKRIIEPINEVGEKSETIRPIANTTNCQDTDAKSIDDITISKSFLNTLDPDVAEMALVAVTKLNSSLNKMKQGKVVQFSAMQYISRPAVVPLNGNKPVTPVQRPIPGCGCLPFSMKQIFSHNKKNI